MKNKHSVIRTIISAIMVAAFASTAAAQSGVWKGLGGDNNWNTGTNWAGGVPNAPGAKATFDNNGAALGGQTFLLGSPVTLGEFLIGGNKPALQTFGFGGQTITFNNSGANALLSVSGSNAVSIANAIALADNLAVNLMVNTALGDTNDVKLTLGGPIALNGKNLNFNISDLLGVATVNGDITGSGNVTMTGAGTLVLNGGDSGFSSFTASSGKTRITGDLTIGAAAAGKNKLGIGDVTISNFNNLLYRQTDVSVVSTAAGQAVTLAGTSTLSLQDGGDFLVKEASAAHGYVFNLTGGFLRGSGASKGALVLQGVDLVLGAGAGLAGAPGLTFDSTTGAAANAQTVTGAALADAFGAVTKTGSGALTLNQTGAFKAADFFVNGGTLSVGSASGLSLTGTLVLAGGDVRFGNASQYAGALALNGRNTVYFNGNDQNFLRVNVAAGNTGYFDLGAGDVTLGFGDITLGAGSVLKIRDWQSGYDVINATSIINPANVWFFGYNKGAVFSGGTLAPSAGILDSTWSGGGGNLNWFVAGNWLGGDEYNIPNAPGAVARFVTAYGPTANQTISLQSRSVTLGGLVYGAGSLANLNTGTLVFDSGVSGSAAYIQAISNPYIRTAVVLQSDLEFLGGSPYLMGKITGDKKLIFSQGSARFEAGAAGSTFTGGVDIENDKVVYLASGAPAGYTTGTWLGTGTITIKASGGRIVGDGGNNDRYMMRILNPLVLEDGARLITYSMYFDYAGDVALTGTNRISISNNTISTNYPNHSVIFGRNMNFTGTGMLTIDGAYGVQMLSGSNTFSGGFVKASGGELRVNAGANNIIVGELAPGNNYIGSGNVTTNSYVMLNTTGTLIIKGSLVTITGNTFGNDNVGDVALVSGTVAGAGNLRFDRDLYVSNSVTLASTLNLYNYGQANAYSHIYKTGGSGTITIGNLSAYSRGILGIDASVERLQASSFYLNAGQVRVNAGNQIGGNNLIMNGGALDLNNYSVDTVANMYLRQSSSLITGATGRLTLVTTATGAANWSPDALLLIQNDGADWLSDGTGAYVRFSNSNILTRLTADLLAGIAFSGHENGAKLELAGGYYYLLPNAALTNEWNGGGGIGNTLWSNIANWSSGTVPNTANASATIRDLDAQLEGKTIDVNGNYTIGRLTFQSTSDVVTIGGSGTLTFSGSDAAVIHAGGVNPTIRAAWRLDSEVDAQAKMILSSGQMYFGNALSGTGAMTVGGVVNSGLRMGGTNAAWSGDLIWNGNNVRMRIENNGTPLTGSGIFYIGGTDSSVMNSGTYTIEPRGAASRTVDLAGGYVLNANLFISREYGVNSLYTTNVFRDLELKGNGILGTGTHSIDIDWNTGGTVPAFTLTGTISGEGGLIKTGAGRLILNSTNDFTGDFYYRQGHMTVTADNPFGKGTFYQELAGAPTPYIEAGGRLIHISNRLVLRSYLYYNSGTYYFNSNSSINGNSIIENGASMRGNATIIFGADHILAGTGGISGEGTSTTPIIRMLGGLNTFSGGWIMGMGAGFSLEIGASSIMDSGTIQSGPIGTGVLTFDSGYLRVYSDTPLVTSHTLSNELSIPKGSFNFGRSNAAENTADTLVINTATLAMGNGRANMNFITDSGNLQVDTRLVDNGVNAGGFIKQGSGTMTLTNAANELTDGVLVVGGVLRAYAAAGDIVTGSASAGKNHLGTAGTQYVDGSSAVLEFNAAAGNVHLSGTGIIYQLDNGGRIRVASAGNTYLDSDSRLVSASGLGILQTTAGALVKSGAGTTTSIGVRLDTPELILENGTLQFASANLVAGVRSVTFNGGLLATGGFNQTFGATTLINSTGGGILDMQSAGIVQLGGIGSLLSTITVNNWYGNVTLGNLNTQLIITDTTGLTSAMLGSIYFQGYALGSKLVSNGSYWELLPGGMTTEWQGAYSSDWSQFNNWLDNQSPNGAGSGATIGNLDTPGGGNINVGLTESVSLGDLQITRSVGGDVGLTGNAILTMAGAGGGNARIYLNAASTASLDINLGGGNIAMLTDLLLQVDGSGTLNIVSTIAGVDPLGNTHHVTKSGTGAVVLGQNNNFGNYTTTGGRTLIGDSSVLGAGGIDFGPLGTGTVVPVGASAIVTTADLVIHNAMLLGGTANTAALTIDTLANSATFAGVISGSGALIKAGQGTLTLTGTNTFQGGYESREGTTAIAATSALGTGTLAFTGNSTLQIAADGATLSNAVLLSAGITGTLNAGAHSGTLAGSISGAGDLTKIGTGTLTLSGSSDFSGNTNANDGLLVAANAGAFGSGTLVNNARAALAFSGGTLANQVTGSGTTIITGSDIRIASDNTASNYAGRWDIATGASARINDTDNLGASSRVAITGALIADGSGFTLANTLAGPGALIVDMDVSSTLTVTGSNTHGSTRIRQGTLLAATPSNADWALGAGDIYYDRVGTPEARLLFETTSTLAHRQQVAAAANGTLEAAPDATLTVTSATTPDHGGAGLIGGSGTLFTIGDIVFKNNTANLSGGAFEAANGAVLRTQGGTTAFVGNRAIVGGAIGGDAQLNIVSDGADVVFQGNVATHKGGGIQVNSGNLSIKSGAGGSLTVTSNTATNHGGAFDTFYRVEIGGDFENITIADNAASAGDGGAVRVEAGVLAFSATNANVAVVSNTAGGAGGAFRAGTGFTLDLSGGTFAATGNKAATDEDGGFLYVGSGSMLFNLSNSATAAIGDAGSIANAADSIAAANDTVSLTKTGDGTLQLWANNTYTGTTFVRGGKLDLRGYVSSTHTIIETGATLAGTGTLGGSLTIQGGGHLAPGASPGHLTVNTSATFNNGAILDWELGAKTNPGHTLQAANDLLIVHGNVSFFGTSTLNVIFGGGPVAIGEYDLINYDGLLTGNATNLVLGTITNATPAEQALMRVSTNEQYWIKLLHGLFKFSYWDGSDETKWDNNAVDGGNGTWYATDMLSGTHTAWTGTYPGDPNGEWDDGTFAIFKGTSGTVTVVNGGTTINFLGAQFRTDGYLLTGGTLTTSGTGAHISLTIDETVSTTIATQITGTHGLLKSGSGTLVLTGSSDYTGATTIEAGKLLVDGLIGTGSGAITTAANAALGGTGTLNARVIMQLGSNLTPGDDNRAGTLTITNTLTLDERSQIDFDLAQANTWGGPNDRIDVTGDVQVEGTGHVLSLHSAAPLDTGLYHLISYGGTLAYNPFTIVYNTTGLNAATSYLQTAIAGEINLINAGAGNGHKDPDDLLAFTHWDGSGAPALMNDGVIAGGSGTWQAWLATDGTAASFENWTQSTGSANAMWKTDGYAHFGGAAAGTVTLDDSKGDIKASGLAFTRDGYLLTGTTLNLVGSATILTGTGATAATISATINSALAGNGGFTKAGEGSLILNGRNALLGDTTLAAGQLFINGVHNPGLAATAGLLGGNGLIQGAVAFTNSSTLAPGALNATGTLTTGALTLGANTILTYQLGDAGNDLVNVTQGTGDLILGGTLNVTASGLFGGGAYRIFNYSGTLANASGLTLGGLPVPATGENYFLQTSRAHEVNLIHIDASLAGQVNYWDGANSTDTGLPSGGSGVWAAWASGSDNWTTQTGSFNAPWQTWSHAMFTNTGGAVTVFNSAATGTVSIKGATFTVSNYQIQGDSILLGGTTSALFDAQTGTTTIASILTGSAGVGITKTGAGTLVLTASNAYTGSTTIAQGTLKIADANAAGAGDITTLAPSGASALLASFTGALANNITGVGIAIIDTAAAIDLTGTNTIAQWNIQGSGTVSGTQNLGAGTVAIERGGALTLATPATANWLFTNTLSGQGALIANLASGTFAFETNAAAASSFTGTVRLDSATFALDDGSANETALAAATLRTSAGAIVNLGTNSASSSMKIHALELAGGRINVQMKSADAAHVLEVDILRAVDGDGTVFNIDTPSLQPGTPVTGNFLTQDSSANGLLLVKATGASPLDVEKQMDLLIGGAAPTATGTTLVVGDGFGNDDIEATYNYAAFTSNTGAYTAHAPAPGVYVDYLLTRLKTNSDLVLDNTGAADTTLSVLVTGTGNLTIQAHAGSITLSHSNSYSGTTTVASGTLVSGATDALGQTRHLSLAADTGFDLKNFNQTVGALNTAAGSTLNVNTGSLAITNGGTSNGALIGAAGSTLTAGGRFEVNGANTALASNVNITGTTNLDHVAGLGLTGTANVTGVLEFDNAAGSLTKQIAGTGTVALINTSSIALAGVNTLQGQWNIAAGNALHATSTANLGSAAIVDNGLFTIANTTAEVLGNKLSGSGTFVKDGAADLAISQSNAYTGQTIITAGTLTLRDLFGAGTGNVRNDSALDLAAIGTYSNNISGNGTTYITANGVNITGSNSTIWNVAAGGSGTVGIAQNLGALATHIDGRLDIASATAWTYVNTLTGTGILKVDTNGNAFNFQLTSVGADFRGIVELARSTFDLSGENTAALTRATLQLDAGNRTTVGTGTQQIGNLTMNGGRIDFGATVPADLTSPAIVKTGTIAVTANTGTVGINLPALNAADPSIPQLPLLQQDEGNIGAQLAQADAVTGDATQLKLVDIASGAQITNPQSAYINQSGTTVATGTYDYGVVSNDAARGAGLYVTYRLDALHIHTDRTLVLASDTASPAAADNMTAKITGDGHLAIDATHSITLTNAANAYTGETLVRTGTLVSGANNALGATSKLDLAAATAFDLNEKTQAIGSVNTAATSLLNLNGGALTIRNGGTIAGALAGGTTASLTLASGTTLITSGNAGYAAATSIAASAAAHITGIDSLGSSAIALNGLLTVDTAASGTLMNTYAGSGTFAKINTGTVTIATVNTGFHGAAAIAQGRVIAGSEHSLGDARVTAGTTAAYELLGVTGTLRNVVAGSGSLALTDSALVIAHENTIAHIAIRNSAVDINHARALNGLSGAVTLDATTLLRLNVNHVQLGALDMRGGLIAFNPVLNATGTATIASLAASSGDFLMNVNLTSIVGGVNPAGAAGNHLTIGNAGAGSHGIFIQETGALNVLNLAVELVTTGTGSATFAMTNPGGRLEYGMTTLELVQGDGSQYTPDAKKWYLSDRNLSHAGDAIINTVSTLALDWSSSLDALHLRMGELRQENPAASGTRSSGLNGNLWVRSRGYRLNAMNQASGMSFRQYGWGVTGGADIAFDTEDAVNFLGGFVDMGGVSRNFDNNGTGDTHSVGVGAYLTRLDTKGWFADAVVRADRYTSRFDARAINGTVTRGRYNTVGLGASIEAGKRLQRADGWWFEPGVQASILHLGGSDCNTQATATQQALKVSVGDSLTAQYRALVRFGRQLKDSKWHPYGKFAAVAVDSTGGEVLVHGKRFETGYDGKRVEFGFGTMYRIDNRSQVYADYEYAKAALYERPWSVNLGYRRLW